MRSSGSLALIGLMTSVALADAAMAQRLPAVAAVTDSATLVGTWRAVSIEADGSVSRQEDAAKVTVVNAGDGSWRVLVDGKVIAKGTSELQPASTPKGIDFVVTADANGPLTDLRRHQGIYELEQDTRRLCFAPPGAERPTSFAAPKSSGLVVVTFERIPD